MSTEPKPVKLTDAKLSMLNEMEAAALERINHRRMNRAITMGATFIADGSNEFTDWSAKMVHEFGESFRPYLDHVWEQAKVHHQMEDPEMIRSLAEVLGFYVEGSAREAANYANLFLDNLSSEVGDAVAEWAKNNMSTISAELKSMHEGVAHLVEKLDAIVTELRDIDDNAS